MKDILKMKILHFLRILSFVIWFVHVSRKVESCQSHISAQYSIEDVKMFEIEIMHINDLIKRMVFYRSVFGGTASSENRLGISMNSAEIEIQENFLH